LSTILITISAQQGSPSGIVFAGMRDVEKVEVDVDEKESRRQRW
jgi:hypothetical protein